MISDVDLQHRLYVGQRRTSGVDVRHAMYFAFFASLRAQRRELPALRILQSFDKLSDGGDGRISAAT
jgi:hypothetical protein